MTLIDRFIKWCQRPPKIRGVPLIESLSVRVFWERTRSSIIAFTILVVAVSSWLPVYQFLPHTAEIFVLSRSDLVLEHNTMPYYVDMSLTPSVWIHGNDMNGNFEIIRWMESVNASVLFPDDNTRLHTRAPFSYECSPEWLYHRIRPVNSYFCLYYRIDLVLSDRVVNIFQDYAHERYYGDLQSLEDMWNISAPYVLNCTGRIQYRVNSKVDEIRGESQLWFWELRVQGNGSLTVFRSGYVPKAEIRVENLLLDTFCEWRLGVTLLAAVSLAVMAGYHQKSRHVP